MRPTEGEGIGHDDAELAKALFAAAVIWRSARRWRSLAKGPESVAKLAARAVAGGGQHRHHQAHRRRPGVPYPEGARRLAARASCSTISTPTTGRGRRPSRRRAASARASSSRPTARSSPTTTSSTAPTRSSCMLTDGTRLPAKLVGADDKADLAVLKVDAGHPLPFVQFGDSDKAQVGDWVMAIGNPFGLGGSVTLGIVSARNRDIQAGPVRRFHPDRCGDQPGQFRRAAVRHGRQGGGHQHGDHRARRLVARHRLCGAGEPGAAGGRAARRIRRDAARLARRRHPGGDRRYRREPRAAEQQWRAGGRA